MSVIHESGEDYLEQILIQQYKGGFARSIDIATSLNFSKPSVSIAMKTLQERGFITMDDDHHIRLTDAGAQIAEKIYNRHLRLTAYLVSLGVPEEIARMDACKMEHDISEESFQAMCKATK